jgi:hypothetical protein
LAFGGSEEHHRMRLSSPRLKVRHLMIAVAAAALALVMLRGVWSVGAAFIIRG